MNRCIGTLVTILALPCRLFAADEAIPAKTLAQLKAATVYVKVEAKEGIGSGSGFLIRVDGDTGLLVTNQHVIRGVQGRFTPQKIVLVFGSGTRNERSLPAEVLAQDREADLAVLKVTAKDLPAPLEFAKDVQLQETMTVFTVGFPLGDLLSPDKTSPAATIGKATISSLREDEHGRLKRVQLDGELNPGNSGGPVVDSQGRLVGIAVSKIVGTRIAFAIPSAELSELLAGRPSPVLIHALRVEDNGDAELEVAVPCFDPLRRIKAVEVRHVRKDAVKEVLQPDKEGVWRTLPGSDPVALKLEGSTGTAKLRLKATGKMPLEYLFQAVCTNGDGKTVAVKPVYLTIPFGTPGVVGAAELKAGHRTPWEVVTSKEGGFTVEMPAKPKINKSRSRGQPSSKVEVLLIGCETEDGTYLAARVAYPTAVVMGAEDRLLDAERDSMVKDWKGSLAEEKKIRIDGIVGREFTIRADVKDAGSVTVRVRQYAIGKAVYVLAVVSEPDADLPDETGRFLTSLSLGDGKKRIDTASSEPRGGGLVGWGTAIDPDKDCDIRTEGKSLAVKVPGAHHDLSLDGSKLNALRVVKAIEGDFVLTVKVTGDFQPAAPSTNPRGIPYNGAGILLWNDDDNFIRLERAAVLRGGRVGTYVGFEERKNGSRGAVNSGAFPPGTCYLRIERKGNRIAASVSADGSAWRELKPIDTAWPKKVNVGLAAISSSSDPFVVKFEEFSLKGAGPEKAEPK